MANRQLDANSAAAKKQIEARTFFGEDGEEYGSSTFGEFGDYFRRKKIKLQNDDLVVRHSVTGKPPIFKDVAVHVASYTQPPPDELQRLLVLHGGTFLKYLDYKTMATHIVATTLPPKKADEWRRLRVVRPAWVVDSVAAGKLLPWHAYRLLGEGPQQKRISFGGGGGGLSVQAGQPDQMASYREQTKASYYTGQMQKVAAQHERNPGPSPSSLFLPLETEERDAKKGQSTGPVSLPDDGMGNLADLDSPGSEMDLDLDLGAKKDTVNSRDTTATEEDAFAKQSPSKQARNQELMTSEEHNALLLSDPKIRKASAANPEFLKQFYSESRLHHLSTWKAELKSKMQRLAAERASQVPATLRRPGRCDPDARRYVMHVDFDSFFCAVSLKRAPASVGKPAAVAHSTGSASEIASCNYPARAFGIKNGMWMGRALELCPDLKVLPYDFPAYEEASQLFYEAILDLGGIVQSVSVDEALVDITGLVVEETTGAGAGATGGEVREDRLAREQAAADAMATTLRAQIKARTSCDVSVGIGGNILLAKVALRRAKPAGQCQVRPGEVLAVLGGLRVEQLPGVAYSIGGKLEEMGVRLVRELRGVSRERLAAVLGPKTGARLWAYARGIDGAAVGAQPVRKSVSAEVNWGIRFVSQDEADEFVRNLCRELERRLVHEQVRGRALTVKILRRAADAPLDPPKHLGHGKCDVFSKTVSFGVATHDAAALAKEAVSVLRAYRISPGDLRGLGVQMQRLEPLRRATDAATADSSQKKLSFATGASTSATAEAETKPAESPSRQLFKKKDPSARTSAALGASFPSTQFFMPPDADFSVLAELPPDIIRRLVTQPAGDESRPGSSSSSHRGKDVLSTTPKKETRVHNTTSPSGTDDLPPDVDPDVFRALPPDVQADVLAEYRQRTATRQVSGSAAGSPVPSPRRVPSPRKAPSPLKGRKKTGGGGPSPVKSGLWGTRGLGAVAAARERRHDAEANRVQTSLFALSTTRQQDTDEDGDMAPAYAQDELDPNVLAALPEDVRAEVLADYDRQRRQRQQSTAQATAGHPEEARGRLLSTPPPPGETETDPTRLRFPTPLPKMRFGGAAAEASSVSSTQPASAAVPIALSFSEVKERLRAWHAATRADAPHDADVAILAQYVAGVVVQERDMDKARRLVTWLAWLVDEDEGRDTYAQQAWRRAVARMRQAVQEAMHSRGLGPMRF